MRLFGFVILYLLSALGTAQAETYAPVIVPYVETAEQTQRMNVAEKSYDDGDYEATKKLRAPLSHEGHPKAINMIGLMHEFGRGFTIRG